MGILHTGGFRSKKAMEDALESSDCDMVGIGRPLCGSLDCVQRLLDGQIEELPRYEQTLNLMPPGLRWMSLPHQYKWAQFIRIATVQMW